MKRLALLSSLAAFLVALLTLPDALGALAQSEPVKPAINQDRVIGKGEVVDGDVNVTNGNLTVFGVVKGDVVVVNGSAVVAGKVLGKVAALFSGNVTLGANGSVGGDVLSNGDVTLGAHSNVGGDVRVIGGKVVKDPTAAVGGKIIAPHLSTEGVNQQVLPNNTPADPSSRNLTGGNSFATRIFLLFAEGILSLVLLSAGVLFVALAPNRVRVAGGTLEAEPVQSLVLGAIIAVLLFPVAGLLSMLLAVSIIGLPLVPVVGLALLVLLLFGLVTVGVALGRWIFGTTHQGHTSLMMQALTGISIVLASTLIPAAVRPGIVSFLMLALLYFATCVGLGAATLSRFGKLAPPAGASHGLFFGHIGTVHAAAPPPPLTEARPSDLP